MGLRQSLQFTVPRMSRVLRLDVVGPLVIRESPVLMGQKAVPSGSDGYGH